MQILGAKELQSGCLVIIFQLREQDGLHSLMFSHYKSSPEGWPVTFRGSRYKYWMPAGQCAEFRGWRIQPCV